jgi:uncharacterized protein with HEPN domain
MPTIFELLVDARNHARRAASYADVEFSTFASETIRRDAVCFCLIIVGEACNLLRPEIRDANTDVPWERIKGMRNRLAHSYWLIDDAIVYNVARNDASALAERLDRLVKELDIE